MPSSAFVCESSSSRAVILSEPVTRRPEQMTIAAGDKLPEVVLKQMVDGDMKDVPTGEFFAGRKVVLFAVPGAFTPT